VETNFWKQGLKYVYAIEFLRSDEYDFLDHHRYCVKPSFLFNSSHVRGDVHSGYPGPHSDSLIPIWENSALGDCCRAAGEMHPYSRSWTPTPSFGLVKRNGMETKE
jgi:hypothetical protein